MSQESYKHVNDMWNGVVPPPLTFPVARSAAKAIWREVMEERLPWPTAASNRGRYTWTRWRRKKTLVIVAKSGWKSFIHDLSHLAHKHKSRHRLRGHHWSHASWERAMIAIVLRDWIK